MLFRCLFVLLLATHVHAAVDLPILSGFDGVDQSTSNTDTYEFVSNDGGTDSRVDVQTSRVHDTANGGDDSSKWAGVSLISTTSTSGYYTICAPSTAGTCSDILPRDTQLTVGASFNIDTPPASTKSRTILAIKEAHSGSDSDYGCAVALNSDRTLTLFYAGGDPSAPACSAGFISEGGSCYTSWGTSSQTLQLHSCTGYPQLSCTAGTQATDCPNIAPGNGTCSSNFYWAGIELGETQTSTTQVTCELYLDGLPIFTGTPKTIPHVTTPAPVQLMQNIAIGTIDGPGTVDGAQTIYFDDLVVNDDENRVGYGYVAREIPTVSVTQQWSPQSCSDHFSCVNDYNTGSFVYSTGAASSNVVQSSTVGKLEKFTVGPSLAGDLVFPDGATVTAIEAVSFGTTSTGNGERDMIQTLYFGPSAVPISSARCTCSVNADCGTPGTCTQSQCISGTTARTQCTQDSDCNTGFVCTNKTVLASGNRSTPAIWARFPVTSSPVVGSSLATLANQLQHGVTIGQGTGSGLTLRVGAMLEYVRVRKADVAGVKTLVDHNGDGKVTVMAIGDSTLTGVHQQTCIGGSNDGQVCSNATYCSWDSTNRGKPANGCSSDTVCRTCLLHRQDFNAGAGYACTDGTLGTSPGGCQLTCNVTTHLCADADGDTVIACPGGTAAECDFGDGDGIAEASDCDATATCETSCPGKTCTTGTDCGTGGVCATELCGSGAGTSCTVCTAGTTSGVGQCPIAITGWANTLATSLNVDEILSCGQDGNKFADMYNSRWQSLLLGSHASCSAKSGTGTCTCGASGSNVTDCGTAGVCSVGGLCTSGNTIHLNCTGQQDCNSGAARYCAFAAPDYMVTLMGYNDMNNCSVGCLSQTNNYNCDRTSSGANQPTGCPTFGAGTFQKTATACTQDSDCSSVSPYSICGGWCKGGGDAGCNKPTECFFGNSTSCTTSISTCGSGQSCSDPGILGGSTCVGGSSLIPHDRPGTCRCTADANCAAGYLCVGPAASAVCRKSCTVDGDCNTSRSLACATFTGSAGLIPPSGSVKVCQGRCSLPCDAVSCTSDDDCAQAGGSTVTGVYEPLTTTRWTGTCNLARGKCANCGPAPCGGSLIQAPCSCTSNGECGGGGTCTNNVCVAGDSAHINCQHPSDCAAGRQCLRPDKQTNLQRVYEHLPAKISKLMQGDVDRMGTTKPVLLFVAPPITGGLAASTLLPDQQCDATNAIFNFYDRDFLLQERNDFASAWWIPARHFIDISAAWEAGKMTHAYHADQVHYSAIGATLISDAVGVALNKLNVCVKNSDGTQQKYCQNANGTFTSTTCTSTCAGGGLCVARPCNGDSSQCPDAGDSCNGD